VNDAPPQGGDRTLEIGQRIKLGDEAKQLLRPGLSPRQFLTLLLEKGHHVEAASFLAHALPKREAVWWGCLCVRQILGDKPRPEEVEAVDAAEKWAADPGDDNRRAAHACAEKAGFDTPAGCVAVAAFFSGGSLAPPDLPVVPPADHLTADMVASAVQLSAVIREPEKAPEKYQQFFALGDAVARGANRWPEKAL
jgi:hypothetical protein